MRRKGGLRVFWRRTQAGGHWREELRREGLITWNRIWTRYSCKADEKEGRRRFCRRTQEGGLGREGVREEGVWREDLGGFPLPMQCHCRLQDPVTRVPTKVAKVLLSNEG